MAFKLPTLLGKGGAKLSATHFTYSLRASLTPDHAQSARPPTATTRAAAQQLLSARLSSTSLESANSLPAALGAGT